MSVDPATFRSVLGRFASGVTIVTMCDEAGLDHGMTVSAFCSLSLEPPLVLVCIDHAASMFPVLATTTAFAVNILSHNQEALSRRFAADEPDRFAGVGYVRGQGGCVLLDDVLAHLECSVTGRLDAGDHTIVIGQVETALAQSERPLLYYRGGYAQLER